MKERKKTTSMVSSVGRFLSVLLTAVMLVSLAPESLLQTMEIGTGAEAAASISNPRIEEDSSMESKQKVTWDCIWFGSYPQTEIVSQRDASGVTGLAWETSSDYEVDYNLYLELEDASYDEHGDTTIGDSRYHRINYADATYTENDEEYYYLDSSTYHYFRYEPIKWRVLKATDDRALLLADKVLDDQLYHKTSDEITWERSTIRSWLNGYASSENDCGINYTGNSFYSTAFTTDERDALLKATQVNDNNLNYGTNGGNDTYDKVFLLSESEVYNTSEANRYGFVTDRSVYDEARRSKSTTYAKAMGLVNNTSDSYLGNCNWWLRSAGSTTRYAAYVRDSGYAQSMGTTAAKRNYGVRPAVYLSLSSTESYSYAGTVCSDSTVDEVEPSKKPEEGSTESQAGTTEGQTDTEGTTGGVDQKDIDAASGVASLPANTITAKNITGTYSKKKQSFSIAAKCLGGAKLSYRSDNKKISVNKSGKVTVKAGYIGKASITIQAAAASGYQKTVKKITVTIRPQKAKLRSVKNIKTKKIQVRWKKVTVASGYQIQIAANRSFTSKMKIITVKSRKKTSLKRGGFKKGKTYYVRIRSYKTVSGRKYYSAWSKIKKVKIKK